MAIKRQEAYEMGDFQIEGKVLKKYNGAGGDVVIPDGVKEIGTSAFYDFTRLTPTIIPGNGKKSTE